MSKKRRLMDFISVEELIESPHNIIAIWAGTGSGKTTLIEGADGLLTQAKVDICTSRKAKVKESTVNNNQLLNHMDELGATITWKGNSFSVVHTNAHIQKYIQEYYIRTNEETYFWRCFDFIVIDEAHSICGDATFADCTFTVKSLIEAILEDQKAKKTSTKIILMTATPEPIEWLVEKWGAKVYDFRTQTSYVKPKSIDIGTRLLAEHEAIRRAKEGQTVVYYFTHLDRLIPLIETAIEEGVDAKQIAVSVADPKTIERLQTNYPSIYDASKSFEEILSQNETIDARFKLVLTNGKNKEAINIRSHVDWVGIESHYFVDIIQMLGRFRGGIDTAFLIKDANQFRYLRESDFDRKLQLGMLSNANQLIKETSFSPPNDATFFALHKHEDMKKCIEEMKAFSLIKYNYLTEQFERNDLLLAFRKHYMRHLAIMEDALEKEKELASVYPYFNGINIRYQSQSMTPCSIESTLLGMGVTVGKTEFNYEKLVEVTDTLRKLYLKSNEAKKQFKYANKIFSHFNLKCIQIGHKTIKEKGRYRIDLLVSKDEVA